jgi:PAS domain S-box-containing protein
MEENAKRIQELLQARPGVGIAAQSTLALADEINLRESALGDGMSFRLLAEAIPQIVFTLFPDGSVEYFNNKWVDYTGLDNQTNFQEIWVNQRVCHPDDLPQVVTVWYQALESGDRFELECRLKKSSGEYRWHLARAVPVLDESGAIFRWFGTCTDIDDHKRTQEENKALVRNLEQSREQMIKFFEESPVGIHWMTKDGTIIWANQAEYDMLGFTRDEFVGHNLADFHIDKNKAQTLISRLAGGETLRNFESQMTTKDGGIKIVRIDANALWEGDQFIHSRTFTRDITDYKEFQRRKDEFLGVASHELKTPITSIRGFAQILQRRLKVLDREGIQNYLTKINAYVDVLNDLVTELLDLSKIQADKLHLKLETFELVPMITEMINDLRLTVDNHPVTFEAEKDVSVKGDRNRIGQVVINFLSNAAKYSAPGEPIEVRVLSSEREVVVSVKDHGPGIPRDKQAHIFERFYRANDTMQDGLGIGLYISAKIVERHHGRIWVESQERQGSTFYFSLPLSKVKEFKSK